MELILMLASRHIHLIEYAIGSCRAGRHTVFYEQSEACMKC